MSEETRQHDVSHAVRAARRELVGAERYRRLQWHATSGTAGAADRRGPLVFDESGFPIAQQNPSFVRRVRRLLNL
jgi:hypothetical protein